MSSIEFSVLCCEHARVQQSRTCVKNTLVNSVMDARSAVHPVQTCFLSMLIFSLWALLHPAALDFSLWHVLVLEYQAQAVQRVPV